MLLGVFDMVSELNVRRSLLACSSSKHRFLEVLRFRHLVLLEAIVVESFFLVSPVAESIPLAVSLCVDVGEIVESNEAHRSKILECVRQIFSSEARLVDAFHLPTLEVLALDPRSKSWSVSLLQRDALSTADLFLSFLGILGSQRTQKTAVNPLSILVL